MPLNLASPGIVVREVDLTVGRVDTASDKVGALVGPFAKEQLTFQFWWRQNKIY